MKTWPGSLFTYQFLSSWVFPEFLGQDKHPLPMDLFRNTQQAILATRDYATQNPTDRATWRNGAGVVRWGLSAAEGPFDTYFAAGAATAAISDSAATETLVIEAEGPQTSGDGTPANRTNAWGGHTIHLAAGQMRNISFRTYNEGILSFQLRYSNDNNGPQESLGVLLDGTLLAMLTAEDTGDSGNGWDQFVSSSPVGSARLPAGLHELTIVVSGGDGGGVELDACIIHGSPGTEDGTVTVYGAGSSIVHEPELAIEALAEAHRLNLIHPRFGPADAFTLNIADALTLLTDRQADPQVLRTDGPWAQYPGFAIDHGPLLILLDNYLGDQFASRQFTAHPTLNEFALRTLFTPWQNHLDRFDVTGDGAVIPLDVLVLINRLNASGPGPLAVPPFSAPAAYYDVNGDNAVAPLDALQLINQLNGGVLSAELPAEGESESGSSNVREAALLALQAAWADANCSALESIASAARPEPNLGADGRAAEQRGTSGDPWRIHRASPDKSALSRERNAHSPQAALTWDADGLNLLPLLELDWLENSNRQP